MSGPTWTPDTSKLDAERAAKAARQTADLELSRPLPHNGTETSKAAAERAQPTAGERREKVLAALLSAPNGLTRPELAKVTGMHENSVNSATHRCVELGLAIEDDNWIRDDRKVVYHPAHAPQRKAAA